ncbi:restriction endonuclease subunit S [Salmonella enterica]|nr:restriction endonuclease subunit S [Salmonella enterica]
MSYKVYSEYKNSGVEWLGIIPSSWSILSAKRLFGNRRAVADDSDEQLAASQKYGVIPQKLMIEKTGSKVALALKGTGGFRKVHKNDFVISLRSFEGGIEYSDYEGCISPAYTVLYPLKNINVNYYRFLNKSSVFISALQATTDSLRDGKAINYEQFCRIDLPFPSVIEQQCIASFLDYEIAKIDRLICRQEQLIELLKEKRHAVISDVVTKGLNPDVKLKNSGSEWLGEVPEHWGLSRIGWLCKVGNGSTPSRDNQSYWFSGDYPWLNSSKVNDDIVTSAEQFVTSKALLECSLPLVKKGSVIIAITGEGKTRGTSALLMMDATINQHIAYMTPLSKNKILPEYLHLWLQSKYDQIRFESSGGGSTKAAITCSDVKKYIIPLPPLNEQKVIVADVEEKKRCFNTLVMHCEQQISLLKERRSALISAAVTGKIDVRNWQPNAKDAA